MLQIDLDAKPAFQPIRTKDGLADWRVRATFPSGKRIVLGAFCSEAEALEWIALKSAEWGRLRQCERRLFGLS